MSKFAQLDSQEVFKLISRDYGAINEFDFHDKKEQETVCSLVERVPSLFFALDTKNLFEQVCIVLVSKEPQMLDCVPKKLRTTNVKVAATEACPGIIEMLSTKELDYDFVKYLYVNYPFVLDDIENVKSRKKVEKVVKKLIKQGIAPNEVEEGEE